MQTLPDILKKIFDSSNYKVNGPLLTGEKTEKVIELMKFELGGKIMKLQPKDVRCIAFLQVMIILIRKLIAQKNV